MLIHQHEQTGAQKLGQQKTEKVPTNQSVAVVTVKGHSNSCNLCKPTDYQSVYAWNSQLLYGDSILLFTGTIAAPLTVVLFGNCSQLHFRHVHAKHYLVLADQGGLRNTCMITLHVVHHRSGEAVLKGLGLNDLSCRRQL